MLPGLDVCPAVASVQEYESLLWLQESHLFLPLLLSCSRLVKETRTFKKEWQRRQRLIKNKSTVLEQGSSWRQEWVLLHSATWKYISKVSIISTFCRTIFFFYNRTKSLLCLCARIQTCCTSSREACCSVRCSSSSSDCRSSLALE